MHIYDSIEAFIASCNTIDHIVDHKSTYVMFAIKTLIEHPTDTYYINGDKWYILEYDNIEDITVVFMVKRPFMTSRMVDAFHESITDSITNMRIPGVDNDKDGYPVMLNTWGAELIAQYQGFTMAQEFFYSIVDEALEDYYDGC